MTGDASEGETGEQAGDDLNGKGGADRLRRADTVVVPAILVLPDNGQRPDVHQHLGDPIRIPVQLKYRQTPSGRR